MRPCRVVLSATGAGVTSWKWAPKPDVPQAERLRQWEEAERKAKQDAGLKTVHIVTNPIANKYDGELQLGKSKYGKLQSESWTDYAAHEEELMKWMTAKQAATILELPEKNLYGLRVEEVEEAWTRAYAKATTERQRHEISAAAEHLAEYSRTKFAQERTKDHFTEKILQTKKEVAAAFEENNANTKNLMFRGLGAGHLFITAGFTLSIVVMYRYLEKSDAELAVTKAKRHFAHATSAVTNEEPAPDYQTRYRDTPTTLDERLQQPHPEITEPYHRQVILANEQAAKREEALLSNMTSDVRLEAEARARDRLNRESLKSAIHNMTVLDVMDSMVKAAPPPAIRDLRK